MTPENPLTQRASAAARVMTARGLLMRVVSACGTVVIVSLVTPAEFGLLAILRGVTALIEQGAELGLVWPLLRQWEEPSREDYAALAGAQLLIVLAVLVVAAAWRPAGNAFKILDREWRPGLLAVLAAMLTIPFGTGARIRLERELRYTRIAFAEVSALLVHTVMLIGFLVKGQFATGVFVAQIAITLYLNAVLYASSPGPFPTWRVSRVLRRLRSSAGYVIAHLVFIAREQAPPLIVAALFGLPVAGMWAFAVRLAKFLQFAYEGFARVAVPTAALLGRDRSAQRRLAAECLVGAAVIAIPAAAVVVFALPVAALFWPQWAAAVPLVQLYVPCDVAVGVMAAALAPIAMALRGWRAVFFEHALPLSVACAGFLLLWRLGRNTLQDVVVPLYVSALTALFIITDAEVRPAWDRVYTRLAAALASGFAVYCACRALGLHPVATAAAASMALFAWLWRQWLRQLEFMARSAT